MALGAQPKQVVWLILRRALAQLAVALPVGVAGAYGVGRLLQSVIVKTNGGDSVLILAIALVMILVSLAACIWPARRAMRLDPVTALRRD
jgi:ABC-type antimicrobial peptide transport system permease subunit